MKNKRGFVVLFLSIVLIALIIFFGYLIFHFYFQQSSNSSEEELVVISTNNSDNCVGIEDSHVAPNFQRAESILSQEQMVKDVPPNAKISLKFYHFVESCRKWDKVYLLRDGKIEEKNIISDIDIWISSDYINKIEQNNLCQIISEARNKGDLGQSVNVGTTKLIWTYKGMLKYRDCLGL